MDEFSTTSDNLDQADEEILTTQLPMRNWRLQRARRGTWPTLSCAAKC